MNQLQLIARYADIATLSYRPTPIAATEYQAMGYKSVAIHASESERDEGFILTQGDRLLIVLRGSDDIADWIATNLRVWREWQQGHAGFSGAAAAVWGRIRPTIELYRQYHPGHPPIGIIGHSRGGAVGLHLAQILSMAEIPVQLFSFGSPRAASPDWVGQAMFDHWRVFHVNDLVPHLPPTILGYAHHGKPVAVMPDRVIVSQRAWQNTAMSIGGLNHIRQLLKGDWIAAHKSYAESLNQSLERSECNQNHGGKVSQSKRSSVCRS